MSFTAKAAKPDGISLLLGRGILAKFHTGSALRTHKHVNHMSQDEQIARKPNEPVFLPLARIYRQAGFDIRTNLNPAFFSGWGDSLFCVLYENGRPLATGGAGISLSELMFFESLSAATSVESIFVIGNSAGWSTLALALLWPRARVAAIDCGMLERPNRLFEILDYDRCRGGRSNNFGIDLTNQLAQRHSLNVRVVLGTSPQDLRRVIEEACPTPPQLVFVDGGHSNEQVVKDFDGLQGLVDENCIFVFHDVVNWHMEAGFAHCCKVSNGEGRILWRTSSGMGVIVPGTASAEVKQAVEAFSESDEKLHEFRRRAPRRRFAARIEKLPQDSLLGKLKSAIKWVNARLPG